MLMAADARVGRTYRRIRPVPVKTQSQRPETATSRRVGRRHRDHQRPAVLPRAEPEREEAGVEGHDRGQGRHAQDHDHAGQLHEPAVEDDVSPLACSSDRPAQELLPTPESWFWASEASLWVTNRIVTWTGPRIRPTMMLSLRRLTRPATLTVRWPAEGLAGRRWPRVGRLAEAAEAVGVARQGERGQGRRGQLDGRGHGRQHCPVTPNPP